ncbi:NUDIX domain-containing protein [Streptomyces sp. NPDC001941]|uniref:NUDIX domain-containing protein n=1 Tax=Streptomyces sp. NPDC001941 TaxID=3154659 RepID=UPI0033181ADC
MDLSMTAGVETATATGFADRSPDGGGTDTRDAVDYVDVDDRLVSTGPHGRASDSGLHHRTAATILLSEDGSQVLLYRRPLASRFYPGHHDVLVGGAPRAGETYRQAAGRRLAEQLRVRPALHEVLRLRAATPAGPCHLTVHLADLHGPLRPDPLRIPHHEVVPLVGLLTEPPEPFVPTGLVVLRRLFG